MITIKVLLALVAAQNLFLERMDVKNAFLHGDLKKDIYMIQLEGSTDKDYNKHLVCKHTC